MRPLSRLSQLILFIPPSILLLFLYRWYVENLVITEQTQSYSDLQEYYGSLRAYLSQLK